MTSPGAEPARCADPQPGGVPIALQSLAPDLWWVRALPGDADAGNRGFVAHLLLARDGPRWWLLGAGPTPRLAGALRCRLARELGAAIGDVVLPLAQAELALGARGWPGARLWAHADVAAAMRRQCPRCEARLRQRLGAAEADLGHRPIRLPDHLLRGREGRLGPFDWRRVERGNGSVTTQWCHRRSEQCVAWGLLWPGQVPDARDADVSVLGAAVAALGTDGPVSRRWLGTQGEQADATAIAEQAAYWAWLEAAVAAALAALRGPGEPEPLPPRWSHWSEAWRHELNWQRAWRQAEDRLLSLRQRSLR